MQPLDKLKTSYLELIDCASLGFELATQTALKTRFVCRTWLQRTFALKVPQIHSYRHKAIFPINASVPLYFASDVKPLLPRSRVQIAAVIFSFMPSYTLFAHAIFQN